jgi:hypothetical protein
MGSRMESCQRRKPLFYRTLVGVVTLAAGLFACTDGTEVGQESQSTAGLAVGRPPTRIDSVPALTLGTALGNEEESFSGDIDATMLSDGRIVVADGGARQLKFFSGEGDFLMIAGGRGGGPGEFSFLSQISKGGGDTLFAGDWRQISRFSPDGAFRDRIELDHREFQWHLPPGQVRSEIEILGEAGLVFISATGGLDPAGGPEISPTEDQGGVIRFPTTYQFAALDLRSWEPYSGGLGPESISPESIRDSQVPGVVPFLAQTFHAPARDGGFLVLGDSRSGLIEVFSRGGRLEASFAHSVDRARINQSQLRAWVEYFLPSRYGFEEMERNWSAIDLPDEMPAFSGIRVDNEGYVWVLDYDWPRSGGKRVVCYTPSGNQVGEFRLEGVSEVLEVGTDYLIGIGFDEFEVPNVVVYPVERDP